MNQDQIDDMKHALKNGNRFYTDSNDKNWNDLLQKGYATKHPGWEEGMAYFKVSLTGRDALKSATA